MPKKHMFRGAVLIFLLAVVCVGACELAFCRVEDPELYHTVVDPAVELAQETGRRAAGLTQAAAQALGERIDAVSRSLEERLERARQEAEAARLRREALQAAAEAPEEVLAPVLPDAAVSLVCEGTRELLAGGKFPVVYYNQTDPAWAERLFGNDPIGTYGCGPTAMAMAVSTLTEQTVDPAAMAAVAAAARFWAPRSGSYLSIVPGLARMYGLECSSLSAEDGAALEAALSSEDGLVVALMSKGHFTQGGHFILLHTLTEDGRVLVADSNSRLNSLTPWDLTLILSEASRLWRVEAAG